MGGGPSGRSASARTAAFPPPILALDSVLSSRCGRISPNVFICYGEGSTDSRDSS